MNKIKLDFTDPKQVDQLMNDKAFHTRTSTLNPIKHTDKSIIVTDPVPEHSRVDSEIVVLSIFAQEIMRVIFPNSTETIRLIDPDMTKRKVGLALGNTAVINSTTV